MVIMPMRAGQQIAAASGTERSLPTVRSEVVSPRKRIRAALIEGRWGEIRTLLHAAPANARQVGRALFDGDALVRMQASEVLACAAGDGMDLSPAYPYLAYRLLNGPDSGIELRENAAGALAIGIAKTSGSFALIASAVPFLAEALGDPSDRVQFYALMALSEAAERAHLLQDLRESLVPVVPGIATLLLSGNPVIWQEAAYAIAFMALAGIDISIARNGLEELRNHMDREWVAVPFAQVYQYLNLQQWTELRRMITDDNDRRHWSVMKAVGMAALRERDISELTGVLKERLNDSNHVIVIRAVDALTCHYVNRAEWGGIGELLLLSEERGESPGYGYTPKNPIASTVALVLDQIIVQRGRDSIPAGILSSAQDRYRKTLQGSGVSAEEIIAAILGR